MGSFCVDLEKQLKQKDKTQKTLFFFSSFQPRIMVLFSRLHWVKCQNDTQVWSFGRVMKQTKPKNTKLLQLME